jgi:hypothetical protein
MVHLFFKKEGEIDVHMITNMLSVNQTAFFTIMEISGYRVYDNNSG